MFCFLLGFFFQCCGMCVRHSRLVLCFGTSAIPSILPVKPNVCLESVHTRPYCGTSWQGPVCHVLRDGAMHAIVRLAMLPILTRLLVAFRRRFWNLYRALWVRGPPSLGCHTGFRVGTGSNWGLVFTCAWGLCWASLRRTLSVRHLPFTPAL